MSFLNALASDGLSVGLRFYTAKMSRASEMGQVQAVQPQQEELQSTREAEAERLSKPAPPPPPKEQTPEEMAAGRAEAKAMLTADGSLGLLQAAASETQAARQTDAAETFTRGEEPSDGAALNGELAVGERMASAAAEEPDETEESEEPGSEDEDGEENAAGSKELTEEEEKQVQEMKRRDQEVHTHEEAHISTGGSLAGAASYEYETGPDGKKYAVAGEVPISSRGSSDPEQALRDAETIRRAAMAPAEPSSQDRSVAAQASSDINQLRGEVADKRRAETQGGGGEGEAETGPGGQADNSRGAENANGVNKADGRSEDEQGLSPFGGQEAQAEAASVAGGMAQTGGAQSSVNRPEADQAKQSGVKVDTVGISMPQRLASNGDSFGSHVLSAYAAAKFAGAMSSYRPALASA